MQTRKMRSGREPPRGPTRWRGGSRAPIPAERAVDQEARTADRQARRDAGLEAQDADQAVATLYQMHYRSLVQLAALLVDDLTTAEEIVQDSFAAVHERWRALSGTDAALAYLRRWVIRQCRAAARLSSARGVPGGNRQASREGGQGTGPPVPGSAVMAALRALPARQREVMVLRYFAELPEAEIAAATGMSPDAVGSAITRAMSALHAGLRRAGE
jgi:DNA-directed RNA polymerase specialized sigma24 family protein